MASCHQIRSEIYLGSLTSLRLTPQYGITHVLSIMKDAPAVKDINPAAKCEQMCIPVDDTEDADLVSWFEKAIEFIRKAQNSEGIILIHCMQGVSRSATVVAAYLMVAENLDDVKAVANIKRLKHDIQPNAGFIQQLKAWKEMGCKLDPTHPYMKERALKELSEQQQAGDSIDKGQLAIPAEQHQGQETIYRCRKCRRLVATSANEAPMYLVKPAGEGRPQFAGKRMNGKDSGEDKDTQIFVEPMQWMDEVVDGSVQGKLHCPGCQARLGSFNWSGMQNSKGSWISPAFALQLGRLDAMRPSENTAKIHKPPL